MPIQFHSEDREEFQIDADKGNPERPTFIIAPLKGFAAAAMLRKHAQARDGDITAAVVLDRETIRMGLAGWRNVKGEDGAEIAFKAGANGLASDDALAVLERPIFSAPPWAVIVALVGFISERSILTADEAKNLNSHSS